jgi:predicted RND superfamily exporter protein
LPSGSAPHQPYAPFRGIKNASGRHQAWVNTPHAVRRVVYPGHDMRPGPDEHPLATRWVAWSRRHARAVLVGAALVVLASAYLIAFRLPIRADFAALLPSDTASVRDLARLERRVVAQDTVLVVVVSPDPARRAGAAAAIAARARELPASLVSQVEDDDAALRRFLREHRHLLVPLAELERARDALAERVRTAKLEANPFYVQLDDDAGDAEPGADLRREWREATARLDRSGFVARDGASQLVVVRSAFSRTDVARAEHLVSALRAIRADVLRAEPGTEIGIAGGVVSTLNQHAALRRGVILSALIAALLVPAVIVLFFRSARLFAILFAVTVVGTGAALGLAALTVGHLNAATAFLGAIVAGNGVNYGIFLIARYNALRPQHPPEAAMALAVAGTARPTIIASLGAVIAYGALAASQFKGFADFAIIGAAGMPLCWIATFALAPLLVLRFASAPRAVRSDRLGAVQARLFGFRRPAVVCAVAAVVVVLAAWQAYRYVDGDPFEYDIRELRARDARIDETEAWLARSDKAFGKGISGATFVAVDRPDQVARVVGALRAVDRDRPEAERRVGDVRSILDLVPADQPRKIEVLDEIRRMLDDPDLAELPEAERAELAELRPPDGIAPYGVDAVPAEVLGRLRERDGTVGRLISVRPGAGIDENDGRDLVAFAGAVRRLEIGDGEVVTTSGFAVIFADIIRALERDAPRVTVVAAIGLVLMVVLVAGLGRRGVATLAATTAGATILVALCALLGIRVNFLDFVALPITLGLGVDYAINVAYPQGGAIDSRQILRSAGASVFVCSLTTMIGYGSLLVSSNLAIRSFGLVSLLGEVCTVFCALIVVPAVLTIRRRGIVTG